MYRPTYSEVFIRLASFVDVSKVERSGIPEDVVSVYWAVRS